MYIYLFMLKQTVKKISFNHHQIPVLYEPYHAKTCFCPMRTTKTQISLHLYISTCYSWNFKTLASLCSWAGWFESYLVGNPEDRFSHDVAHVFHCYRFKDSSTRKLDILGPVVQSIVSLMKSLVNDSFSLLVRLKSSVLIFFAEKMWGAFALQKLLTFFQQKMAVFLGIICLKF